MGFLAKFVSPVAQLVSIALGCASTAGIAANAGDRPTTKSLPKSSKLTPEQLEHMNRTAKPAERLRGGPPPKVPDQGGTIPPNPGPITIMDGSQGSAPPAEISEDKQRQ